MTYADFSEYLKFISVDSSVPDASETEHWLARASRTIDTLTYNRIPARGFDRLTEFQREIIREVCCRQAEFERESAGVTESLVTGYSINGVSAQFAPGWNIHVQSGAFMPRSLYGLLEQTGLCCRSVMV